jgi:hypothetical protein
MEQFMIIDSDVALVADRLVLLVLLGQDLRLVVRLDLSDLKSISDVLHRRVVHSSSELGRLLLSVRVSVAHVVDKVGSRAHL